MGGTPQRGGSRLVRGRRGSELRELERESVLERGWRGNRLVRGRGAVEDIRPNDRMRAITIFTGGGEVG